jgi:hypothetical protein
MQTNGGVGIRVGGVDAQPYKCHFTSRFHWISGAKSNASAAPALKLSEPDDKNKYYARRLFIFMGTETAALVQARVRVNRIIPGEIANFDKLTFNTPF